MADFFTIWYAWYFSLFSYCTFGIKYLVRGCKIGQVQADSLATLGVFAYLGKMTRLFLSQMGINDLDEQVKDFLR